MIFLQITGVGIASIVLSYFTVTHIGCWAEKWQILDIPNERSSHALPIPRGGGLAIAVISLIGFIVIWLLNLRWPLTIIITFLCGAAGIATISYLDDLYSLPNRVRLTAHSLAALVSIWGLGYWHNVDVPLLGQLHLGWLGPPITFLWIVGLTNAYNFMDGIDGIAGGQGVVAGLGWGIWGLISDHLLIGTLGLLLAASCLGFLGHNWPPARIFMGDVGSAFLGYAFSVLAVLAAQEDSRLVLAGVLFVWPFVFDTSYTFFCRLRRGENVFIAHRSHLYQRLVVAGCSHRFVSSLYIGLSLIGVILSLVWSRNTMGSSLFITIALSWLCLMLWAFVTYQERRKVIQHKY
jgi:UDP-N-acetylmuramyl pentapeptide phosphotransferase/UDP-N-acetylglucosamine-1-phosphate transferase